MSQLFERKGFKIETTLPQKKKKKDKKTKSKVTEHIHIIDDDAPVPWSTTTTATAKPDPVVNDEIVSVEDDPVVVGIIDERPTDIRDKERFKDAKRWRTAAFEEVPEPNTIGPQLKSKKSSRQKQNLSDDSDPEIDRRQKGRNDSPDFSPPRRKTQQNDDNDPSPPRRRRQSDDDPSPPRRKRDDPSPPRRRDSSPPRRKHKHNDDPSPPRRRDTSSPPPRKRNTRDDDSSPPRRRDKSSPSHRRNDQYSRKESSPSSSTNRRRPKEEPSTPSSTYRRPKEEPATPSSTHPQSKQESSPPPFQPAKSERRRLAEHKEKVAERYTQWGRGLAQVRQTEDSVKDYLEQSAKPLARYRNDEDLDSMLKQRERDDDPMLKYLSNKTSDAGDRTNNSNRIPAKPRYKGPDPQKNRFDIWPGYRWDGVDRSNGYERKLFETIANRHAKAQEAYLWSVEDM